MTGFCSRPRDYIPTTDATDAIVSTILNVPGVLSVPQEMSQVTDSQVRKDSLMYSVGYRCGVFLLFGFALTRHPASVISRVGNKSFDFVAREKNADLIFKNYIDNRTKHCMLQKFFK